MRNESWKKSLRWFAAEFAVVVSGILVALALQSWWAARDDRRAETALLRQMLADLAQDSAYLWGAIYTDSLDVALTKALASHLDSKAEYSDTLKKNFSRLGYAVPITLRTTQYQTLKSRGLELVRDDTLRSAITTFYEVEGANVLTHNGWITGAEARWMPVLISRLKIGDGPALTTPRDYQALLNDPAFRVMLDEYAYYTSGAEPWKRQILTEMNVLLAELRSELQ